MVDNEAIRQVMAMFGRRGGASTSEAKRAAVRKSLAKAREARWLTRSGSKPGPGFVYVVEGEGRFKIGMTTGKVTTRLRSIQTNAPFPLTLIHEIPSDTPGELELMLHQKFAAQRNHGEWFALSASDIAWLKDFPETA